MSTPSDTMRTATIHGRVPSAKRAIRCWTRRVVGRRDHGRHAVALVQQAGDAAGVVLVGRDHQTGRRLGASPAEDR